MDRVTRLLAVALSVLLMLAATVSSGVQASAVEASSEGPFLRGAYGRVHPHHLGYRRATKREMRAFRRDRIRRKFAQGEPRAEVASKYYNDEPTQSHRMRKFKKELLWRRNLGSKLDLPEKYQTDSNRPKMRWEYDVDPKYGIPDFNKNSVNFEEKGRKLNHKKFPSFMRIRFNDGKGPLHPSYLTPKNETPEQMQARFNKDITQILDSEKYLNAASDFNTEAQVSDAPFRPHWGGDYLGRDQPCRTCGGQVRPIIFAETEAEISNPLDALLAQAAPNNDLVNLDLDRSLRSISSKLNHLFDNKRSRRRRSTRRRVIRRRRSAPHRRARRAHKNNIFGDLSFLQVGSQSESKAATTQSDASPLPLNFNGMGYATNLVAPTPAPVQAKESALPAGSMSLFLEAVNRIKKEHETENALSHIASLLETQSKQQTYQQQQSIFAYPNPLANMPPVPVHP